MGKLSLKIVAAKSLVSDDYFTNIDPYLKISCGGKGFRTATVKNASELAVFNEQFSFTMLPTSSPSGVQIQLWNQRIFGDSHLATAIVPICDLRKDLRVFKVVRFDAGGEVHLEMCIDFAIGAGTNDASVPSSPQQKQQQQQQQSSPLDRQGAWNIAAPQSAKCCGAVGNFPYSPVIHHQLQQNPYAVNFSSSPTSRGIN